MTHHMNVEWIPGWLVRRYKREPRFDMGERPRLGISEREAQSKLRHRGLILVGAKRDRAVEPADPVTKEA